MEGVDPKSLFEDVKEEQNRRTQNATEVIEWFLQEEHIGEMYLRSAIVGKIADELSLSARETNVGIADVVGDIVDPLQQIVREGDRFVGVIDYRVYQSEGAYGYIDFDDKYGKRKRVVCARCVETEEYDDNIAHATEGEGSNPENASWQQLLNKVTGHYADEHSKPPTDIEPGASLLNGTTISGNTAFHAGNENSISHNNLTGGTSGNPHADSASDNHGNEVHSSSFTTLPEVNSSADVPQADNANTLGGQQPSAFETPNSTQPFESGGFTNTINLSDNSSLNLGSVVVDEIKVWNPSEGSGTLELSSDGSRVIFETLGEYISESEAEFYNFDPLGADSIFVDRGDGLDAKFRKATVIRHEHDIP